MKLRLESEGWLEVPAALVCAECSEELLSTANDDETTEADELIRLIQVHQYACAKRTEQSAGLYHAQCGTQLTHQAGSPHAHRCPRCNRSISLAEQMRHEEQA